MSGVIYEPYPYDPGESASPLPKDGTCSACRYWKDGHYRGHYPLMPDGTCTNMVATLGAHIGTGRYATCKHFTAQTSTALDVTTEAA